MIIYHKKYMSGVCENVFKISEMFLLLSLRDRLLLTICLRIPCIVDFIFKYLVTELETPPPEYQPTCSQIEKLD